MKRSIDVAQRFSSRALGLLLGLFSALLLSGCSSYVVVESDLSATLTTAAVSLPTKSFSLPADQPRRSGTTVEAPGARWSVGTSAHGLGGGLVNTGNEPICIEFQNGKIATDVNRELRPWPAIGAFFMLGSTPTRVGWIPPKLPVISLNEICVAPGQRLQFGITLEPGLVSGEAALFGARRGPDLAESVKGRTLTVELPFRVGANKDSIRFEWTAVSAFLKTGS